MSGVIQRNLKKNDASISNRFPEVRKRDTHTRTHAHNHTNTHAHTNTVKRFFITDGVPP